MDLFEELLQKLINPEADADTASTFDELREYHSMLTTDHDAALGERDGVIAEHEVSIAGGAQQIEALTNELLEVKAANYDAIMNSARDTGGIDPDIPIENSDDEEDFPTFKDAFEPSRGTHALITWLMVGFIIA